jgi:hypothetical protein
VRDDENPTLALGLACPLWAWGGVFVALLLTRFLSQRADADPAVSLLTFLGSLGLLAILSVVAQQLGCSQTYVQRLSSRNHWSDRVEAFDAAQDRAEQKLREPQIREMRKRHAELAAAALEKAREGWKTSTRTQ